MKTNKYSGTKTEQNLRTAFSALLSTGCGVGFSSGFGSTLGAGAG